MTTNYYAILYNCFNNSMFW